jgi:hypothetical protein
MLEGDDNIERSCPSGEIFSGPGSGFGNGAWDLERPEHGIE